MKGSIKKMPLAKLQENPDNPRTIRDEQFDKLVESIRSFPEMLEARPIVVNPDHVVLGGNMRLKAAREAGLKQAPVYVASWEEAKQREFIIKDNLPYGEWDWGKLDEEWSTEELEEFDLELPEEPEETSDAGTSVEYSKKIEGPTYEPADVVPSIEELYDTKKHDQLLQEIEEAGLDEDVAQFLRAAATRHTAFNYQAIADYYASAPANVQDLMERSALVIIDYGKALEYGFVKMSKDIAEIVSENE